MRPRLLDLFCGAGGAAMGYQRAGFDVVGVDIAPQPRFPFTFVQADALTFPLDGFDAIHASPPCQGYSDLRHRWGRDYPRLIEEMRERLTGRPYVIENVQGAPLLNPVTLCGSMFGLGVWRHRIFEIHPAPLMVPQCQHVDAPEPVDVTGTGSYQHKPRDKQNGGRSRKPKGLSQAREVMGIDWMERREISEAIPPAYTEYIGRHLLDVLATQETPCPA